MKNIRGKPSGMDFYWVSNPEYLNLDGTKLHSEVHGKEAYIAEDEICFHDCRYVRPAGLPDVESAETSFSYSINFGDN